jgi:hypothetical protein
LAGVLRAIWLEPGRNLLLPRLVHDLAKPLATGSDGVLRLSVLGEELMAQDGQGEGRALVAEVATELVVAKATQTISWGDLAAERSVKFGQEERGASAPRFLAVLFRRAAAFQHVCKKRSNMDERFLTKSDEAAHGFMAQLPIGDLDAAAIFVKCLDAQTIGGISSPVFTQGSGCTVEDMLRRTEELWKDLEKSADGGALRMTCETILERMGSLQLARARMPAEARTFSSRSSQPSALDYLCVERLFRVPAKSESKGSPAAIVPFVGYWWQAPPGPRGLGEAIRTTGFDGSHDEGVRRRSRWDKKSEHQNLRRWERSGFPQIWVEAHRHQWNHQDWTSLLRTLSRTEFWPMEPDAVGMVLEGLKRTTLQLGGLPIEAQNLIRWERSGFPRQWVQEHSGRWNQTQWIELLASLKASDFWPMMPSSIGMLLEWMKGNDNEGSAPVIPIRPAQPPGPSRPGERVKKPERQQLPASVPVTPSATQSRPQRRKSKK